MLLQEISQALCISFEDVCKLQQDNLDLFYWFERRLEDIEKEYEEEIQNIKYENDNLSAEVSDLESDKLDLNTRIEVLEEEVKALQELLEENGIDYTEAE